MQHLARTACVSAAAGRHPIPSTPRVVVRHPYLPFPRLSHPSASHEHKTVLHVGRFHRALLAPLGPILATVHLRDATNTASSPLHSLVLCPGTTAAPPLWSRALTRAIPPTLCTPSVAVQASTRWAATRSPVRRPSRTDGPSREHPPPPPPSSTTPQPPS